MRILHFQVNGNIRTWKESKIMKDRGHRVSLFYVKHSPEVNQPGLSDEIFDECDRIDMNHPRKWIAKRAVGYDVIHTHNDNLCVYAQWSGAPVVHDIHDMASLIPQPQEIIDTERMAVEHAHKLICSSDGIRDALWKKYGFSSKTVWNYPLKEQISRFEETRTLDRVVYAGKVGVVPHRKFGAVLSRLAEAEITVDIYAANELKKKDMIEHRNVNYKRPVNPFAMIKTMSLYNAGLIPFDHEPYRKHLDTTMAHKFWDYLAAGIPVFTTDTCSYRTWFQDHPEAGGVYRTSQDLIHLIRNARDYTVSDELVRTMDDQGEVLEGIYESV